MKIFLAKNFVGKILLQISGSGSVDPPVVNTATIADGINAYNARYLYLRSDQMYIGRNLRSCGFPVRAVAEE
jgi:hypothetical protein